MREKLTSLRQHLQRAERRDRRFARRHDRARRRHGAEPGPTGTSARNSSTSMIATPDRVRGAGFRTTTSAATDRAARARSTRRSQSTRRSNRRESPRPDDVAARRRPSIAVATSSIEQPHSVSCGCAVSRSRHARSTSARRDVASDRGKRRPRLGFADAASARRGRSVRFSCARVANVPCSVHV